MVSVSELRVKPLSMVTHDGLQRVDLTCRCEKAAHFTLQVFCGERQVAQTETAFQSGNSKATVLLPLQGQTFAARWRLVDRRGDVCAETEVIAVNACGQRGEMSPVFCGITKESLESEG